VGERADALRVSEEGEQLVRLRVRVRVRVRVTVTVEEAG